MANKRPIGLSYWAIGDSITAGQGVAANLRFANIIAANLKASRPAFYFNQGMGGWASVDWLPLTRIYQHSFEPDIVTILLGTNDAGNTVSQSTYNSNLTSIIQTIKGAKISGACDIYLMKLVPRFDAVNLTAYNTTIASVAAAQGVNLVETSTAYPDATYTQDNIHPTAAGHTNIANILWAAINARQNIWGA